MHCHAILSKQHTKKSENMWGANMKHWKTFISRQTKNMREREREERCHLIEKTFSFQTWQHFLFVLFFVSSVPNVQINPHICTQTFPSFLLSIHHILKYFNAMENKGFCVVFIVFFFLFPWKLTYKTNKTSDFQRGNVWTNQT